MSTVESGRRVALLARPGAARDCVRAALLEIGAQLVAEEDPVSADPEAVRAASPQVLMIVLDSASEDSLGRFDAVIGDPAIEVMFEEAEVALAREGWEAARWRRHLAAKLHHLDDVLPPSGASTAVPSVDALSLQIEELMAVDEAGGDAEVVVALPPEADAGNDFSIFDPVAAENGAANEDFMLSVDGLAFDPAAFDAHESVLPPVTGPDFSASDFDPLLAELDAHTPDTTPPARDAEWQGGEEARSDGAAPPAAAPTAVAEPRAAFGELSLADEAVASTPAARSVASHDLDELARRISSLQLVDDDAPTAAAPAPVSEAGVVLVMAGLGGPDAVRQFLGALPVGFPRAVLVRQHLDGARYDKLVAQMQRATQLPVALAAPSRAVTPGTVYVVGDGVSLDTSRGLRFVAGTADAILDALPPAQSAVVLLSGSRAADAASVAALATSGLWMGAQATDGCYDPVAPEALAALGAVSAAPAELARQLAQRWSS